MRVYYYFQSIGFEDDILQLDTLEAVSMVIAGDSLPKWEVTEAPEGLKETEVVPGASSMWREGCWLATFHPPM